MPAKNHPARIWSLTLSLTLLLSGLLVIATPTGAAQAASAQITDGAFVWGVKTSWRNYIGPYREESGAGSNSGDGATVASYSEVNGRMVPDAWSFPVESGEFDPETNTTTLDLAGFVHFRSWYGQVHPDQWALDTKFSDLSVVISADEQVLRGTHTGYLREDPGGALHEDVDVVLARLDLTNSSATFGPPTTSFDAIPVTAGPGLSIYGEGTTLDNASLSYQGPGALPDLTEHFDAPGVPALEPAAEYSTGRSGSALDLRQLLVSGDGATLFAITRYDEGPITFTALDAETMTPLGTPFNYQPVTDSQPQYRFTIDPATDTLFFLGRFEGEPVPGSSPSQGAEHVIHSLTFDGSTFTEATIGKLRDSKVTLNGEQTIVWSSYTSALTWNPIKGELLIA